LVATNQLKIIICLGLIGFLPTFFGIGQPPHLVAQTSNAIAQTKTDSEEQANIRVYQLASPAVVSIRTESGSGSGTIIDPTGLVLTSGHVVRGANKITVSLANQQRYQGQVIAISRNPDLALIQLENVKSALPVVKFSSSGQVLVGQRVFAIGDPFGRFAGTLTTGIISRIDRDRQLLQTDASINPGNSGGPLLNSQAELIGVNTSIFTTSRDTRTGIGFAISGDRAQIFVKAVQTGKFVDRSPEPVATNIVLDGKTIFNSFSAADETLPDGSYYKSYKFVGKSNQSIVVEMRSNEIDSFLALFDPKGIKIAEDDDSGGKKDAQIKAKLPISGTYTIYANSYALGEIGRFSLTARLNGTESSTANQAIILQRRGILNGNSESLTKDGTPFDLVEFRAEAGQVVKISLSSQDFQPYLILIDPNRRTLKQDRALSDRRNAEVSVTLEKTGIYRLVVNTFDRKGKGEYSLIVRRLN
jgi:Trypsin-like peptidase domain